jgi:hypothetical protein
MAEIVNGYKIEPGADLRNADLRNADLSGADLAYANLRYASLVGADFRNVDLSDANFTGATLSGAKHDYSFGQRSLLQMVAVNALATEDSLCMSYWHKCETAHCIAGWAVALHPHGKELEENHDTETAGWLLLGDEARSHFYENDDQARSYLRSILPTSQFIHDTSLTSEN